MRLRPQALFGVRSAGRVRPSDHPRETHPSISSARKYWGPREYPCRKNATRVRGDPVSEPKRPADLNAGQRAPASRLTNTFVLPSAIPPRRGFRKPVGLRFLTPASGQGTTPSATQASPNRPSYPQNFSRFARKPGRCPVSARQRGSRGLVVPLAPSLRSLF